MCEQDIAARRARAPGRVVAVALLAVLAGLAAPRVHARDIHVSTIDQPPLPSDGNGDVGAVSPTQHTMHLAKFISGSNAKGHRLSDVRIVISRIESDLGSYIEPRAEICTSGPEGYPQTLQARPGRAQAAFLRATVA